MSVVAGVDPSLSSTGVAILDAGELRVLRIQSRPGERRTLVAQVGRLRDMTRRIRVAVADASPVLVVMEGPAYGVSENQAHYLAGFWWRLASSLCAIAPVAVVQPGTLKKYATGSGRAEKDRVLLAADRAFPGSGIAGNDEADAAVLAAMGATYLGEPASRFPGKGQAAILAVRWPEVAQKAGVVT